MMQQILKALGVVFVASIIGPPVLGFLLIYLPSLFYGGSEEQFFYYYMIPMLMVVSYAVPVVLVAYALYVAYRIGKGQKETDSSPPK